MSTLTLRHRGARLAVAGAVAGVLAAGALAGPAMAAGDAVPSAAACKKGGNSLQTPRKAGGQQEDFLTMRKSGGDPQAYIIVVC
jgi:hypothetical protein